MVQTWETGYLPNATCPRCEAEYEVKIRRIPLKDRDSFDCEDCETEIARWNTTEERKYTKIKPGKKPAPAPESSDSVPPRNS